MMLNDWLSRLLDRRVLGAGIVVSAMTGLVGPFGTYGEEALPERVVFWTLVIGLSLPVAVACRAVVDRHLARLGFWSRALIVCTAFTLAYAPLLQAILLLRIGPDHQLALGFAEICLVVFAIALLVNLLDWMVGLGMAARGPMVQPVPSAGAPPLGPSAAPGPARDTAAPPRPRLVARLPPDLRDEVLSVSVRDHYVDVHTARGAAGLLMRLSDAIGELDGVEGAQIHRSHWVAKAAVSGVERTGGRVLLRLVDGRRLPVSRGRLPDLADRGWL